ncbi:MAG: glutathione S-transferase family protein [Solirubrobacterales bacterium]
MGAKLYVIPASHPSKTVALMLEAKGIPYKRVDLMPVISKGVLKAQRFPGMTVPALKIDGERIQGSREIARALDSIQPEPPLFPSDPKKRAKVEEVESWGDEFQHRVRQPIWWALKRDRSALRSYSEGARLGIPIGLAVRTAAPIVALSARFNEATDDNVRADLAALPADLDRIDGWIKEGVLGGERLNAADLQIAPTLRLAMTMDDLRPLIENRPAGELARRAVPDFPGRTPPVFPAEWLGSLRS